MKSIVIVKVFTNNNTSLWHETQNETTIETVGSLRTITMTAFAIGESVGNALASMCHEIEEAAKNTEEADESHA